MIDFTDSCEGVEARHLQGFFVNWTDPPTPATHLRILKQSGLVVLARDDATGDVVGFVTALTDGVLSASIPLLEVLPTNQGQGIGKALLRRMIERLGNLYMIDTALRSGARVVLP